MWVRFILRSMHVDAMFWSKPSTTGCHVMVNQNRSPRIHTKRKLYYMGNLLRRAYCGAF